MPIKTLVEFERVRLQRGESATLAFSLPAKRLSLTNADGDYVLYAGEHALMVGIESRSSSPQRLPRNRDSRVADGFASLYPIGEGAGYAGGIMSAAIDGAKSAQVALARPASHS